MRTVATFLLMGFISQFGFQAAMAQTAVDAEKRIRNLVSVRPTASWKLVTRDKLLVENAGTTTAETYQVSQSARFSGSDVSVFMATCKVSIVETHHGPKWDQQLANIGLGGDKSRIGGHSVETWQEYATKKLREDPRYLPPASGSELLQNGILVAWLKAETKPGKDGTKEYRYAKVINPVFAERMYTITKDCRSRKYNQKYVAWPEFIALTDQLKVSFTPP